MILRQLFKGAEIRRLTIDGTNYILAAGTSDVNSGAVNMTGYDAVAFVYAMGTIAASGAVSIKVQQSDDDGSADAYSDLAGTAQGATADTDDNKLIISEIYRPEKQYVRVATTRGDGGNSTIDFLGAILHCAGDQPVTQGATVYGYEAFSHPAEGTA